MAGQPVLHLECFQLRLVRNGFTDETEGAEATSGAHVANAAAFVAGSHLPVFAHRISIDVRAVHFCFSLSYYTAGRSSGQALLHLVGH